MGKTVEYPAEFKIKAVKTYLEGNHGRVSKSSRNVWDERYASFKKMGKAISRLWRRVFQ